MAGGRRRIPVHRALIPVGSSLEARPGARQRDCGQAIWAWWHRCNCLRDHGLQIWPVSDGKRSDEWGDRRDRGIPVPYVPGLN